MTAFLFTSLFTIACHSPENPSAEDGWWQNEEANPYTENEESEDGEFEEGEEDIAGGETEESGFFGLIHEVENGYIGENGVEKEGCMWYVTLTGASAEACPECSFAITITYEEFEIGEDNDCPEGYAPDDFAGTTPTIGFGNGAAWQKIDNEWLEFAEYFQEDVYHVWFVEF